MTAMLSTKPAWAYGRPRSWRARALDLGIALATVLYIYWEYRTGDVGGLQYGLGVVTGYVVLRARDAVVRKFGWGGEDDD